MNRLIEALSRACKEHLLGPKWLLAPSLRVGHQWVQSVARAGQPALNLQVKTLKSLANDLADTDRKRLTSRGGALVIDAILATLRADRLRYLSQVPASVSLSEAVHRSILDIRLAGLRTDLLRAEHFEDGAKGRDLATVLTDYVDYLARNELVDYADIIRLATEQVQSGRGAPAAEVLLLVPEDTVCKGLEQALLVAWPSECVLRLRVDEATHPGTAPQQFPDHTVEIYRAVGEVNEVREVLRRCVAKGFPFDEVEVLHTDAETYVPLFHEVLTAVQPGRPEGPADRVAGETGEPSVTFVEGLPCRYSRPGRALAAWIAWTRDGYSQSAWVAMVREGLLAIADPFDDTHFAAIAALLRKVGIGFGRERYLPKLERHIDSLKRQIEQEEAATDEDDERLPHRREWRQDQLRQLRAVRAFTGRLLEMTPSQDAERGRVLDSAVQFLNEAARCVSKLDNYAHERLVLEIEDMKHCLDQAGALAAFDVWEWLAALPASTQVLGSGPRPGHLHVAPLTSGGHSGRRYTFIVGLDDGRFPGGGLQDPLLLDGERKKLTQELTTSADRLAARQRDFARLLARLRGCVTFSYSGRNLKDDRDLFPSPALLAIYRLVSGKPTSDQTEFLTAGVPRPVSFAPEERDQYLNESEWWLWRLCDRQPIADASGLVGKRFPHLERGWEALRQRGTPDFTIYDGRVEAAGADLDPTAATGPILSSHKLETAGRCPLAYFFQHVLDLKAPEDMRVDRSVWLDARARGQFAHRVFERFLRETIEARRLPVYDRDMPRLREIFAEHIEICKDLLPPPSDSVFDQQHRELQRMIQVFLKLEAEFCANNQCAPAYLEVGLGLKKHAATSALDCAEPLTLALPSGLAVRVAGKVDRIDRIGDGAVQTFAIWDYKSSSWSHKQDHPFRQGRAIQPYLYLTLVGHRLREVVAREARVLSFGFFFPGMRDRGRRMQWEAKELAEGNAVLERLCRTIRQGAFLATDSTADCTYCDYRCVCGDVETVAAGSRCKLDNPANTLLQPMLELRPSEPPQDADADE